MDISIVAFSRTLNLRRRRSSGNIMANAESGAGIPVTSFYSCHRTRSARLQAATDALFEELDNGNLSDVDGEFDDSDDEGVLPCASDEAPMESDSESSDDESALDTSGGWRRKSFKAPDSTYKGDVHEASELGELQSPTNISKGMCQIVYFWSWLKNKPVLGVSRRELRQHQRGRDKASSRPTSHNGCSPLPRLRLYWKPNMRCDLVACAGLSRNRFEKLRNNLHIVDVNYPDATDRLWKW
ncbi:uncharacterized protein LOC125756647 [Rhipicephalus sanguineus]|uniref:uncharacterized protein LOC125756647 n=1 Tax=Rhipicephalus sanguineus TaxID=34632 RepID=UPI0020C3A39D|nr:uncharacterized protein LOC125756647 [Rhipicephalus sanguineus]